MAFIIPYIVRLPLDSWLRNFILLALNYNWIC